MSKAIITKSNLDFLNLIKKNNNRDWFNEHKDRYLTELKNLELFADNLLVELNKHDVIETVSGKKSLHRIYRDVRFSKEKTPYNTHWGGGFKRATKSRRGSYYYHLEPGNSFVAIGFWGPEPADLKRIRDEFSEAIDLLRYKQFLLIKKFTDQEVLDQNFIKTINETFKISRPFLNYMSEALTTDTNGISLV